MNPIFENKIIPNDESLVYLESREESIEEEIFELEIDCPKKDTISSYKESPKNPPNTPRTVTDWPSIDFGD